MITVIMSDSDSKSSRRAGGSLVPTPSASAASTSSPPCDGGRAEHAESSHVRTSAHATHDITAQAEDIYNPNSNPTSTSPAPLAHFHTNKGPARRISSSAPTHLTKQLSHLQVSETMSKRIRSPTAPREVRTSPFSPSSPSNSPTVIEDDDIDDDDDDLESVSRKCQRIIAHISASTSVDPADQLRSDQLATVPRSYQLELAQVAKAGNVLVCLDTGSGKTLISVLLLQHVHSIPPSIPSSSSSASSQRKVSFFLVNLVPLVHQQSSVIAGNSTLSVGKLYGELKDSLRSKSQLSVDNWREPQWSALLASHQVVVSTAQCFLDALIHGFVKMSNLNLLIFDEVHHALKNHPFFRIMKYYRLAKEEERPKIFGMTASPIFTSTGKFDEAGRYLQRTMDARIHTVSKGALRELNEVKQKPEELVIELEPYNTILDDWFDGADYSELSKEMLSLFARKIDLQTCLDDDEEMEELDPVTEAFEKEVRPKLEYTLRHLGPIGCDFLWHSTLLEYRSRARKWANIDRNQRTLVSDEWIVEASTQQSLLSSTSPSLVQADSQDPNADSQGTTSSSTTINASQTGLGLGLSVAHLSTNPDLNSRILLHMHSQPPLPSQISLSSFNASPKLLRLVELLRCFQPSSSTFCGIIFVERRQTATLLVELIKRIPGLEFIHPELLLGHDNGAANRGATGMDWHDQVQVLNRFRRRKPTNLLVATSIAEEGLDIQAANLVIRFDLFNRHISFLQSRGRARAKESRFILMAERGNKEHAQAILNAFNTEANRAKWLKGIADGREYGYEDWQQKLRVETDESTTLGEQECIFDPKTGARLFPEDAPTLISHYASTLHSEYLKDAVLAYRVEKLDDGILGCPPSYQAVLELPSTAAVRSVNSGACRNKKTAKRMAAFRACQQLRALGELDEWLMPKLLPRIQVRKGNAAVLNPHHQAWRGSGKPVKVPVKRLDGWARFTAHITATGQEGVRWYGTLLQLHKFDDGYQPLLLLTRAALPETKLLKLLDVDSGRMKDLQPKLLGVVPQLNGELLEWVMQFTKFVFKLISRREGHVPKEKRLSWQTIDKGEPAVLVVPVRIAAEVQSVNDVQFDLPTTLDLAQLDLTEEGIEEKLRDRVLVRQHDFHSHSFYQFEGVERKLSPNSPLPSGEAGETYLTQHLQIYAHRRQGSSTPKYDLENLSSQLANSPLFNVRKLPKLRNLLTPPPSSSTFNPINHSTTTTTTATRLIIPHFYSIHPLPSALLHSLLLLPSILTRYDQLLLASTCNSTLFSSELNNDLVLEALTSSSTGSEFDYERLEFLGDTFLKLVATCHTFTTHLGRTEAELHMANKGILTNVRLLKEANRLGLERWAVLPSCGLLVRRFSAPVVGDVGGRLIRDDASDSVLGTERVEEEGEEGECDIIKEKTLSDIIEALIGAALVSSPTTSLALFVCRTLDFIPPTITTFSDFNILLTSLKQDAIAENWSSRLHSPSLLHLQKLFSHEYKYPHLALESFTHPSLLASVLPSYQRLEFLGDAWIDFFIVRRIWQEGGGELKPGEMTALKGVLASNAALGALGVKLGLHKYIASNSSVLVEGIGKYEKGLTKALQKKGGKVGQYWTDLGRGITMPKAVADVVEASFASIVVDSGFDEGLVEGVFERIFSPFYEKYCRWEMLKVYEVKRVIDYVFATLKRVGGGANRLGLEVKSNLFDLLSLEASGEQEGMRQIEEENLLAMLLTPLYVELKIRGKTVAKIAGVLASTPLHLTKAIGIAKDLTEVQASMTSAMLMDDNAGNTSDAMDVDPDPKSHPHQSISIEAESMNWPDLLKEQQHLLLELTRTLGWKTTIQITPTLPSKVGQGEEGEELLSLAQIRELSCPPTFS